MKRRRSDQLADICRRYGVNALYAFGSRATEIRALILGESPEIQHPDSDVDLAARTVPEQHLTLQDRVRLALELEDFLQVKKVDLVLLSEADPFLALDVIRGEVLYFTDPVAQAEDELYILRRAGDLAFQERLRREQILFGAES